jgi:carbon storage regulator CsrA
MLVLTRRVGESITVTTPSGDVLIVTVVEDRHRRPRLGITAPKEYIIARTELLPEQEKTCSQN